MRRLPVTVTAAAVLVVGVACSPGPDPAAEAPAPRPSQTSTTPSSAPAEAAPDRSVGARPVLVPADAGTVVLPATDPATAALSASQALFASSPVVVLVDSSDAGAVPTAVRRATALRVPLLTTSGDATAAGPLGAELARLGTTHALAIGTAARDAAVGLDGVEVVSNAGALPPVEAPEPAQATALLVSADPGGPALATATSAGATAVTVPGGDPRGDVAAIGALADAPPTRVVGLGEAFGTAEVLGARVASAATGVQLPGGGQLVLAGKRYVALYGHPGTPALGLLGEQDLPGAVARAQQLARAYRPLSAEPVLPTFEVITTVASAGAGADGNYSNEVDPEKIRPWIEEAGRQGVYVLLDLQPGTTDFLTQAQRYEDLLRYPNVGLALDPEWRLASGQRHLEQIGSVSAAEVNQVSAWLAGLVREQHLPQKMLVLHQFRTAMITDIDTLETGHDELAVVIHADGNGTQGAKAATWGRVVAGAPAGVAFAWKNFVDEDSPMATPAQTMAVRPTPVLITYQ